MHVYTHAPVTCANAHVHTRTRAHTHTCTHAHRRTPHPSDSPVARVLGPSAEGLCLRPLGKGWFPESRCSHPITLTSLTLHFKQILRFQNGCGLDLYGDSDAEGSPAPQRVVRGTPGPGATAPASGAWGFRVCTPRGCSPAHSALHPQPPPPSPPGSLPPAGLHARVCALCPLPPLPHRPGHMAAPQDRAAH